MLSYQHIYHAGNAADLHKHALLAWIMGYLTAKDKPLSYIETHSGRGLYDLASAEARKTAEADTGIRQAESNGWPETNHPLMQTLADIRVRYGNNAYPGSPLIAQHFLRPGDHVHLAELHPTEYDALSTTISGARLYHQDGFQLAHAITPPTPRRGLMLIDPSYEIKSDYVTLPVFLKDIARKWNVGILVLWYPILIDNRQAGMLRQLEATFPDALKSEIRFPPAKPGHGMTGSGMFIINPPWGLPDEVARIEAYFRD
ncbi:MAG: 23S rRNA (adenine(2030)-N(6))-methyltransferase RlmJ [Paracoccus sp. (in: a-proteobacteria)]